MRSAIQKKFLDIVPPFDTAAIDVSHRMLRKSAGPDLKSSVIDDSKKIGSLHRDTEPSLSLHLTFIIHEEEFLIVTGYALEISSVFFVFSSGIVASYSPEIGVS